MSKAEAAKRLYEECKDMDIDETKKWEAMGYRTKMLRKDSEKA